jgi:hypothetical protein
MGRPPQAALGRLAPRGLRTRHWPARRNVGGRAGGAGEGDARTMRRQLHGALLQERPGARNKSNLPRLTEAGILAWADSHYRRTGRYPVVEAGPIADAPGETWKAVHMAVVQRLRGLPGGGSLARLLKMHRGVVGLPSEAAPRLRGLAPPISPCGSVRVTGRTHQAAAVHRAGPRRTPTRTTTANHRHR